ncbi:hypothetical protein ABN102_14600 [Proteus vulgaris]|uniref:Wzy n=2 Tax=Proteus vulgaris TaxID=585 RepID=A0A385JMJ9_PROVU|nr:hypothetical protein [Proteus vulgaris]AXY99555.1 wzy [Proteus vulgaris]AYY82554.1 hypothetical protein EGX81_17450 [Proteus vulgaris]
MIKYKKYNPILNKYLIILLLLITNMQTTSAFSLYFLCIFVFGLIAALIVVTNHTIKLNFLISTIALILILGILTKLHADRYVNYIGLNEILYKKYILVIFWSLMSLLSINIFIHTPNDIIKNSLSIIILIMSFFVILQLFSYYILNITIDFSLITGGIESRSYFGNYRPSGFLPEPAVYCGHMSGLLSLYLFYNKKIDKYFILGVLSIFITQSTVGVILVSLIISIYLLSFKINKNKLFLILAFLMIILLFIAPEIINRINLFLQGTDTSNNLKVDAVINFLKDDNIFIFGYGLISKDHIELPTYYEAIKDLTIFGSALSIFGIFFGIIIIILLLYILTVSHVELLYKIILFIPLLKLCSPSYAFFYIYISLFFIILLDKRNKFTRLSKTL